MIATAPVKVGQCGSHRQRELSIHVPVRRPLMPMKAAMWYLERNETHILSAIPDRIRWAFDIHCKGDRANVLIYRSSAEHCRALDLASDGRDDRAASSVPSELDSIEDVINSILPQRPILRGVEVQNIFKASQDHIANLITTGLLQTAAHSPTGPKASPFILRASVAELLKQRRYLP
jgi:hypothetical protein